MKHSKKLIKSLTNKDLLDIQRDCKRACNTSSNYSWRAACAIDEVKILTSTNIVEIGIEVLDHWAYCDTLFGFGYSKYLSKKTYNTLIKYRSYNILDTQIK